MRNLKIANRNFLKNFGYGVIGLLFISLVSCQNEPARSNSRDAGIVSPLNITISVSEFESKIKELTDVQLLDVRTPEEYKQGHLAGALNYNINSGEFAEQVERLDKNKAVLVYCLSGGRSASAADYLAENGFTEVYNMDGGVMSWNAVGKPMEAGEVIAKEGLSQTDFNKLLQTEKLVLVDFNAKWCKPCKKMAPMLDKLAESRKDKLVLVKIDADENKELLREKGIESIPVLELYKDGKIIWSHNGEIDEATLLKETNL